MVCELAKCTAGTAVSLQLNQPVNQTFCQRFFCLRIARSDGCCYRGGYASSSRPRRAKMRQRDTVYADQLPSLFEYFRTNLRVVPSQARLFISPCFGHR